MIYITGDTHGDFSDIWDFCTENETTAEDVMIILGDAGINYYLDESDEQTKRELSTYPITLFCIHGNHEERPELVGGYEEKLWCGGTVYWQEEFPNQLFAKDGEIYNFNGSRAIAIGGAYSVDKYSRLGNGAPWFSSEQPDEHTMMQVEAQLDKAGWRVDYVFSHTAPLKFEPTEEFLPSIDQSAVDKSTEEWLDSIENRLDYDRWYLGHYHCEKDSGKVRIMFHDIEELE